MGDKPFLQIEFDEHYSKVGVITRIEAFLNSISHRPPVQVPDGFNILDVDYHPTFITDRPAPDRTVLLPQAGWATPYLADYFRRQWLAAEEMPAFDRESLTAGRSVMNSKEYLPLPMLVGSAFRATTAPPHRSSSSAGRSGSRSSPAPSAAPGPSAPISRSSSRRPTAVSRTLRAIRAATATPRRWSSVRTPTRCSTACRTMRTPPSSSS